VSETAWHGKSNMVWAVRLVWHGVARQSPVQCVGVSNSAKRWEIENVYCGFRPIEPSHLPFIVLNTVLLLQSRLVRAQQSKRISSLIIIITTTYSRLPSTNRFSWSIMHTHTGTVTPTRMCRSSSSSLGCAMEQQQQQMRTSLAG